MSVEYRRTKLDDLVRNLPGLASCYGRDEHLNSQLPHVWSTLFDASAMIAATTEDRTVSGSARIVSMGASVFVTDSFAEEIRTTLPPNPGAHVARRILEGRSPVLGPDDLKNLPNGAALCIMHDSFVGLDRNAEPSWIVKEKMAEAFLVYHSGYRISEYLQQVRGRHHRDWMLMSGMRLRHDYSKFFTANPNEDAGQDEHPYLIGVTRQEMMQTPGARAFSMFIEKPFRLRLSTREQDLIRRALAGDTDEELSGAFDVSLSTIKKRWAGIYDHIETTAPDALGSDAFGGEDGRRGSERRRHLLAYIREHPEELAPPAAR